jgi:hypothetical protein
MTKSLGESKVFPGCSILPEKKRLLAVIKIVGQDLTIWLILSHICIEMDQLQVGWVGCQEPFAI